MSDLRYRAMVAKFGEPTSAEVTQEKDGNGLPVEVLVASWTLPSGSRISFVGSRPGDRIGRSYAELLKRITPP